MGAGSSSRKRGRFNLRGNDNLGAQNALKNEKARREDVQRGSDLLPSNESKMISPFYSLSTESCVLSLLFVIDPSMSRGFSFTHGHIELCS